MMATIIVRDHTGRDRVIAGLSDWDELVAQIERRRDELAEEMLADDINAAARAEEQSDYLEDVIVNRLQAEASRVQALVDADAAVARRHAKAEAIKNRNKQDD